MKPYESLSGKIVYGFVPVIMMAVCYVAVFTKVAVYRKRMYRASHRGSVLKAVPSNRGQERRMQAESKVTRVGFITCLAFGASYVPSAIFGIVVKSREAVQGVPGMALVFLMWIATTGATAISVPLKSENSTSGNMTMLPIEEGLLGPGSANKTEELWFAIPEPTPMSYRVLAIGLQVAIFIGGVAGNMILIYVALRSKFLRTPTYAYLVSLAFADLLVIIVTIPEAVIFDQLGNQWLLGTPGCAAFVFLNFLGINAGSLSTLAVTVERYIGICHPLLARKICTLGRTKRIIASLWIFAIIYCSPWLLLTEVKPDTSYPFRDQCSLRLPQNLYIYVFGADLVLFYVVPLNIAVIVYVKIGRILFSSLQVFRENSKQRQKRLDSSSRERSSLSPTAQVMRPSMSAMDSQYLIRQEFSEKQMVHTVRSRIQILRMLVVVVVLFAICWLPYRGLLVYNTFVSEPWMDIWYMLFAKTAIYLNSAINPFLYNIMSQRFRTAVRCTLRRSRRKPPAKKSPAKLGDIRDGLPSDFYKPRVLTPIISKSRNSASRSSRSKSISASRSDLKNEDISLYDAFRTDSYNRAAQHFSRISVKK